MAGGIEDARLALGGHLINLPLRTATGIDRMPVRTDRETPDVGLGALVEDFARAVRSDPQHQSARPGPGVQDAVAGQGQAKDLAIVAGEGNAYLARGSYLVDLALVAGGREQVAGLVLDDIPYVGGFERGQRLELSGQADRPLVADHGMFEAGLLELSGGAMVPDLDLGGLAGASKRQQNRSRRGQEIAMHNKDFPQLEKMVCRLQIAI